MKKFENLSFSTFVLAMILFFPHLSWANFYLESPIVKNTLSSKLPKLALVPLSTCLADGEPFLIKFNAESSTMQIYNSSKTSCHGLERGIKPDGTLSLLHSYDLKDILTKYWEKMPDDKRVLWRQRIENVTVLPVDFLLDSEGNVLVLSWVFEGTEYEGSVLFQITPDWYASLYRREKTHPEPEIPIVIESNLLILDRPFSKFTLPTTINSLATPIGIYHFIGFVDQTRKSPSSPSSDVEARLALYSIVTETNALRSYKKLKLIQSISLQTGTMPHDIVFDPDHEFALVRGLDPSTEKPIGVKDNSADESISTVAILSRGEKDHETIAIKSMGEFTYSGGDSIPRVIDEPTSLAIVKMKDKKYVAFHRYPRLPYRRTEVELIEADFRWNPSFDMTFRYMGLPFYRMESVGSFGKDTKRAIYRHVLSAGEDAARFVVLTTDGLGTLIFSAPILGDEKNQYSGIYKIDSLSADLLQSKPFHLLRNEGNYISSMIVSKQGHAIFVADSKGNVFALDLWKAEIVRGGN